MVGVLTGPRPPSNPGVSFEAITPADSDLTNGPTRAVWVGGSGNLSVIGAGDTSAVLIEAIAAGTLLPISVKQIRSTNTTATKIVAIR
jgi:hypothetical protein